MKKTRNQLLMALIAGSLIFTSCGNNSSKNQEDHHHENGMEHEHGKHESSMEKRKVTTNLDEVKGDITLILNAYFNLKDKLAVDDANGAADAGNELVARLKDFDKANLNKSELQEYDEIMESAEENAQHISDNANEIIHQREHLVSLSEDIRDMIALVGTDKKLYEDFCPMANNKKGAIWISEKKEISNPYMGTKMPTCGKINREIN
jgi:hypothetical protein